MRVAIVLLMGTVACGSGITPGADAARDALPRDGAVDRPGPDTPTAVPDTRARDGESARPEAGRPEVALLLDAAPKSDVYTVPETLRDTGAVVPETLRDTVPETSDAAGNTTPDASGDTRVADAGKGDAPRPITLAAWPGDNRVVNASVSQAFGTNVSGLVYEPAAGSTPAILWAVQNNPSKVYRLTWNGVAFVPVTTEGWGAGKTLSYPSGTGSPDSEGLTRTEWDAAELYVVAEESNNATSTSRPSILRYELTGTATTLRATHEWNLTADLPGMEPNKGLEAIAWVPDTYLVARGFYDEAAKAAYDPARYANHGTGIFLVGTEATGMIYGYVVDHQASTFKRVATFSSGQAGTMDLAFDRETGTLWSLCDGACDNHLTLFDIDTTVGATTQGRFILRATVPPPTTLSSTNNEGITMAPEAECANNRKGFFWADDDESKGYAIRRDTIPCGRLF
jgi:hypothetical protein